MPPNRKSWRRREQRCSLPNETGACDNAPTQTRAVPSCRPLLSSEYSSQPWQSDDQCPHAADSRARYGRPRELPLGITIRPPIPDDASQGDTQNLSEGFPRRPAPLSLSDSFDPLKLTHTSYPSSGQMPTPYAHGYADDTRGAVADATLWNPAWTNAAGRSSPLTPTEDLGRSGGQGLPTDRRLSRSGLRPRSADSSSSMSMAGSTLPAQNAPWSSSLPPTFLVISRPASWPRSSLPIATPDHVYGTNEASPEGCPLPPPYRSRRT